MARLKEDETILVVGTDDEVDLRFNGIYRRDTRYLSTYAWEVVELIKLASDPIENRLVERFARIGPTRAQELDVRRELSAVTDGLTDCWTVSNLSLEPQQLQMRLVVAGDFGDLFARHVGEAAEQAPLLEERAPGSLVLSRTASDGVRTRASIVLAGADDQLVWSGTIAPGQLVTIEARVVLDASDDPSGIDALPTYNAWRGLFASIADQRADRRPAMTRAIDDLRMLLLSTEFGPYPAAGMPWFGNKFGRDALITAIMVLPWCGELMVSVLRLLAFYQGKVDDTFREEAPGKIMHEIRCGELSRTNAIPFARYYGSVDATALFLIALDMQVTHCGRPTLAVELGENVQSAVDWLVGCQEDANGLIRFKASGSGLVVQSWKDSADSMNHADGSPGEQPLAVAEVQGYAYAAFQGGARLLEICGHGERAAELRRRADALAVSFHAAYWLDELDTYAMAIDKHGHPLRVQSSGPGHLLWCGIVPVEIAPRLVATLMGPELWSGWGLRTLGCNEARYAPVSYHNGSVWPHDTALLGAGLARYGFRRELVVLTDALFDLAAGMPDHRMPELIAGHDREDGLRPVRYASSSAPQAWAAAALPMLARLVARTATSGESTV